MKQKLGGFDGTDGAPINGVLKEVLPELGS